MPVDLMIQGKECMTDNLLTDEKSENFRKFPANCNTLIDAILDGTGKIIAKITGGKTQVSFWYSAAILCLFILLLGTGSSIILGETGPIRQSIIPVEIFGVILAYVSLVIFKLYIGHFLSYLSKHILSAIISVDNWGDFHLWLRSLCNHQLHFVFIMIYGLTLGTYTTYAFSWLNKGFIGFGPAITCCLVAIIWGLPMYLLIVFLYLPFRLSKYEYRLFKIDPGSSEVIVHLLGLLGELVYFYAIVAGASMAYLAFTKLLSSTTMVLISILVAWLPITILFISNHYAVTRIITRAKWRELNEIQAQIEEIRMGGSLAEKESMEKINRLIEYHDRLM